MSKSEALTARLDLKVLPELLVDLDIEVARLRMSSRMFGNRRPKHAAIIMAAVKNLLTLPPEQRDAVYAKWFSELAGETPATTVLSPNLVG